MRYSATAILLLVLLPATARADMSLGLPGLRDVWFNYTFTVDAVPEGVEFYLMPEGAAPLTQGQRLALTPSTPVRLSGPVPVLGGGENTVHWRSTIYVVKKSLLAQVGGDAPTREWLKQRLGHGVEMVQTPNDYTLDWRRGLWFTDNREAIEVVCRIEEMPEGWRLVKVSENAGNPWVRWGWYSAGIFTMLGVTSLGIWIVRSRRRNR